MIDRAAPDPTPRPGAGRDGTGRRLYFSQRCCLNALETGMRVLVGAPLAPRAFYDLTTERTFYVSQETGERVEAP